MLPTILIYSTVVFYFTISITGIDDTTGAVTDVFQDKYFRIEEIGNFVAMVPGLVDVSKSIPSR